MCSLLFWLPRGLYQNWRETFYIKGNSSSSTTQEENNFLNEILNVGGKIKHQTIKGLSRKVLIFQKKISAEITACCLQMIENISCFYLMTNSVVCKFCALVIIAALTLQHNIKNYNLENWDIKYMKEVLWYFMSYLSILINLYSECST